MSPEGPGGYRIHPPYWRRIHRDSVAFVVDAPSTDTSDLFLRYTIRNPNTGDTVTGEVRMPESGSGARLSYLAPEMLGGRAMVFSPFLCDLRLFRISTYLYPEAEPILSKRFSMDPNPESLDLHPFVAHFFPDRIGMILRSRSCGVNGIGAPPIVTEKVRTLLHWEMAARDGAEPAGCASDSVILLRFQSEIRIPIEPEAGKPAAFANCSGAMEADLVFNAPQWIEEKELLCEDPHLATFDSAQAANSGFTREFLFGGNRLVSKTDASMLGGFNWSWTLVSGIGKASRHDENGVSRIYNMEEILEVK